MHATQRFTVASLTAIALFGLTACDKNITPPTASDTDYIEQSLPAVTQLQQQLSSELKSTIKAKGVVEAIQVCANVAQPMTASISSEAPDWDITRTALRVRNPANQPDAASERILQNWQTSVQASGEKPAPVVLREGEQVIVYHPIILQNGCLACHGDPANIAPEVADKIAGIYPEDQATGFAVGDLRGAFRVAFAQ
jgi:cytochrome c5